MSHICGTVEEVAPSIQIGPDTGVPSTAPNTWQHDFSYAAAGTKFVILHFTNVSLPAANQLEVELGYGTDVFTSADGLSFWTRPINIHQLPGSTIQIRYVTSGANNGSVRVDRYGRGQSLQSVEPGFDSITNCDPFLPSGWTEPNFPHIPGSTAPKYDATWICDKNNPPVWENVRCAALGTVQRDVSRSCGMIVSIHAADEDHPQDYVSTCSVTLIDSDLVALAGHCVSNHPFEVPTSSVTFDYEVSCDGSVLIGYDAVFYKVIGLVKYRWNYSDRDYAILQLRGAPPVPPVPMRYGFPAMNEAVFGLHHPNGAVKKVSPSATGSVPVEATGNMIRVNLDVSGGSSGSGLFDLSGRMLGVASGGLNCIQYYSSTETMLEDPIDVPDPPTERAVMLALDRSGSMTEASFGGGTKIDEARDAAELFISMLRTQMGNEAGLVTFATDATIPAEEPLGNLTMGKRNQLLNELPGISPGGRTSIGDGLSVAQSELSSAAGIPRSVLLLTDGMENEPQFIADVGGLGSIEITAIGFGTESNLDGARLTDLAQTHGGYYKRAGTGLELRKFFALAFGDIFEAGALADPELHLSDGMREGPEVPFSVCGEEAVTVVIGWDDREAILLLEIKTPSGAVLDLTAGGIETDAGKTWSFARVPLPQNGERNGTWTARVRRPGGSVEFPPPAIPVEYFINVLARGGPSLRPLQQRRRLYTGDVLHPKVIFQYADETVPQGGKVTLDLRRPNASVGTILTVKGLGAPRIVDGDVIPARQATLSQIETDDKTPVVTYVDETHAMSDSAASAGTFRPAGVFGVRVDDALVVEGTYTFHARARIDGDDCTLTREVQWSEHVSVGIDPDNTPVTVTPDGSGGGRVVVTFTPQDRYGNFVGPGASDEIDVTPLPGCETVGDLVDLGDGCYSQTVNCDPDSEVAPGVVVAQPDRDPVVLVPEERETELYRYAVPIHCGSQDPCCDTCAPLRPGRYATAVHLVNGTNRPAAVRQSVLPATLAGVDRARWPETVDPHAEEKAVIPAGAMTVVDCCGLSRLLLGGIPPGTEPLTSGTLLIDSSTRLHVSATYTVTVGADTGGSIDVEVIEPERLLIREKVERPSVPERPNRQEEPRRPAPRPQDLLRRKTQYSAEKQDDAGSKKTPAKSRARKSGKSGKTSA